MATYPTIGVVIGTHARLDVLPQQLESIRSQSIPPTTIRIVHDGPSPPPQIDAPVVATSKNMGVFLRFFVALDFDTEYIAIFDDDTIPGPRWFENCLNTLNEVRGPVGARGVIYLTSERDMAAFGWPTPSSEAVEVDVLGHCWFLKKEWLSHYGREPRLPGVTTAGEDYHLSYIVQKYLNMSVWAAPHPPDDRSWWGSLKGYELGNDERALWKRPGEREKRRKVHEYYLSRGWTPLGDPQKARRKYIYLSTPIPTRPRVAWAIPQLVCGGAEQSTFAVAKNLSPQLVDYVGLVCLEPAHWPPLKKQWESVGAVAETPQDVSRLLTDVDILIHSGLWKKEWKVPLKVFISHGIGSWTATKAALAAHDRQAVFVAVSKMAAGVFHDLRKVTVIYNGVLKERLMPKIPRGITRNFLGIHENEIAVGYVGRVVEGKGIVEMVAAVKQLGPPFRAIVAGPCWNLNFRKRILENNPDTIFLPPVDHVGDIYAALDCSVCFSESEGFGMSIVESWACGIPTVTSPVGCVPELQEAYGPLTIMAHSSSDLPHAIKSAVQQFNKEIVEKAQKITLQYLTAEVAGRRWSEFLSHIWRKSLES